MGSKMLLAYNIREFTQEAYMRFIIDDFVPTLQTLGLDNVGVWHTAYGDYPMRLLVFVAESSDAMKKALETDIWDEMEHKLKRFVSEYSRRVIPFDPRFQF